MRLKRIGIGAAALLAGVGALVLLAHAPYARRAVLRYAIGSVQESFGLTLAASRLDYSLATFRVGLADLRVSAPGSEAEPFFEAGYVSVVVSPRALRGELTIRDLIVTDARARVHYRADGTSNLPVSSGGAEADPAPLPIDRIELSNLALDVVDDQADVALQLPATAVMLTRDRGSIALSQPGQLRVGVQTTSMTELTTQATFDGRTLRLAGARLRTDEAMVELDGALLLVAREPSLEVQLAGTGDIARLARWGMAERELPQGALAFAGRVTGPMAAPRAQLRLTSDRITLGAAAVTDVTVDAVATSTEIEATSLTLGFESGRVTATASVPFAADAERRVEASWTGVDATAVTRLVAPDATTVPAGLMAGTLSARGTGTEVSDWAATMRLEVSAARNARGRLAVPGASVLALDDGTWRLTARHSVGGVAPVELDARGPLGAATDLADVTIEEGALTLGQTAIATLLSALGEVGLASVEPGVVTAGSVEATMTLGGLVRDPEVAGGALLENVAGDGFEAPTLRAELSGRPLQPDLTYSLDVPALAASGQRLRDVRATGRVVVSAGPLRATRPADARPGAGDPAEGAPSVSRALAARAGDLVLELATLSAEQADGSGMLSGSASYVPATGGYAVSVQGTGWQLLPTIEQPATGFIDLRFVGTGTVAEPRGDGEIAVREAAWQGTALGNLAASVTLAGQEARFDARAPDFNATATGRVQLAAPYAAVVDARADRLDLARVLRDVATPTPVGGLATGSLHVEGPLDLWRTGSALVELAAVDATVGRLPVRLSQPARFRYEGERLHVDAFEAAVGETALSASGAVPVFSTTPDAPDAPGVLVVMTGGIHEVAQAVAATGLTTVPLAGGTGPVALLARVTGSIEAPAYAADLEVGPGSIVLDGLPTVSGLQVKAHAGDGWFELREAVASYQSANVTATGRVPLAWLTPATGAVPAERGELQARATNLTASLLAPFLDPATIAQMTGSLDATLRASSTTPDLAGMTGEFQIDRLDVRVADLPIAQRIPTRIVARDGIAHVEAWDWIGQGATLGVSGQVGLVTHQVALLASGVVDLRMLTPFVRDAGISAVGRFEPRIAITGPLDDPRIDGDAVISGGEVRLADPRVLISDLRAQATLNGTSARITALSGSMNGGALAGSGSVGYTPAGAFVAQLAASVRGMALEFPEGLRSEVDGDLALVGGMPAGGAPSGRLSGTVTVLRGSYREPIAVVAGLMAGARVAAPETSPFLSALALDIRLLTDEDIFVDNNYGRVQLGADLRVIGTAAVPALSGRAELREGGQLFIGRNVYAVTFGTIDFSNPLVIEPNLNVQATTRAGGEDIEVRITGLAESPSVDLRSTTSPDLGQAEVASLLLTGRRLEDLAPGDAAFVGTQVLGNFSGEVLGFASRAVGLDTLRLGGVEDPSARRDPTAAETSLDPTTRLTFGKSLGPDLDVTFSQSLRNSDAQAWIVNYALSQALNDGRRRPWLVEYVFKRGLELRLVSNDDDLRSYGFRHDVAFGAVSRPMQPGTASRAASQVRIAGISVSGALALPEQRVREELRLAPGDRFDFADWQADRDRVEALYRREGYVTARLSSRRTDEADGVRLAYEITAGPRARIEATGLEIDDTLRSQIEDAWAGSVSNEFLIDEVTQLVRADVARRGYLRSMVDAQVRPDGDETVLAIAVEPGPRSTRTLLRLEGVADPLAREVEVHLGVRGAIETAVADPGRVGREAVAYLRGLGYLRARVTVGVPLYEEEVAVVPVRIDAGAVFAIAKVTFDGARALPEAVVRSAAGLVIGMPYDPAALDGARDGVASLHRREGFRAATVTVQPVVAEQTSTVDVGFTVIEGARDVLAEVVVTGNRAIDADVITRRLDLTVGAPLRADDVLQGRTRVFGTGLFRRIDLEPEPVETTAGDAGVSPVRLRVTVEEWPALRLRYGFLVAEERDADDIRQRNLVPGFSADVSRRTLFGRAVGVGAAVGWQQRERRGRVFLSTPTLAGWPVESSLIAEQSHEEFEGVTFVTDRSRMTWEQRVSASRRLNVSYAYTFERNRTFDTQPNDTGEFVFDIRINIARLNAAVAWDTRDDPLDATRGLLVSSGLELSPEMLGSDIRFVRQVTQGYYFRPWRGVVFASAARLGTVTPLGGQEVIPSERFLGGGSRTVRGVAENSLGPRDYFGPVGGQMMVILNQEARVPIYRWVRGVAFVDAGNVFAERRDARLSDLVGSLGIGLRVTTPFALLRVDYAKATWGTPSAGGLWTFGIGHAF